MTPGLLLEAAAGVAAVGRVGAGLPDPASFAETLHAWHDFYLLAGTAAATLAGLLFVSLSLNLDRLVEPSHAHLLALAHSTLISFLLTLVASLMMLTPNYSVRFTAITLITMAIAGMVISVRFMLSAKHSDAGGFSRSTMWRRNLLPLACYALIGLSGYGIRTRNPEIMNLAQPGFCALLGNAVGVSFELLVAVARHAKHSRVPKDA